MRRIAITLSGTLCALWCVSAQAQLPPALPEAVDPKLPAATASGTATPREAQLEAMVKELSQRVDELSARSAGQRGAGSSREAELEEMVRQLSQRVDELSARTPAGAQVFPGVPAPPGAPSVTSSGLAGPGGFRLGVPGVGDSGLEAASTSETRAVSGGTREFPNSQLEGNRRLGQIPVRTFFDYDVDGVGFATEDDEFQLRFRILSQIDFNGYLGPEGQSPTATTSGFYLPRSRYYFQGRLTKPITYDLSFQRSYTTFNFFNAFLNFNYDPRLQIRVGRSKVPFTYEFYKINVWRLIAPERSVWNNNYQSNRDIGITAWGGLFDSRVEYATMLHNGPRNGFQAYDYPKTVAAFLNFKPFVQNEGSFLRDLNVGGSLDYGYQNNPPVPAVFRTNVNASNVTLSSNDPTNSATLPFLSLNNNVREKGLRDLWELHAAYYYKGLSLLGAWDSGFNSYAVGEGLPVRVPTNGYFVQVAYLVTGETIRERTVIDPINRFDLRPGKFGLGAFEPHARYSEMFLGRQVFTDGMADPNLWTNNVQLIDVGVNWYLNKFVKVYFDWEHAIFASPVLAAVTSNGAALFHTTSDLFWLRLQFYY
jgi:phosphate-selective porin OprO/OprP